MISKNPGEYSHRNYTESKTDHHIFDEFWQIVRNTGGMFGSNWGYLLHSSTRKQESQQKMQALLWVEFGELLQWCNGRQENPYC